MKKITAKVIKVSLGILLFILLLLFTVPVLFKEKIKTIVESSINKSLDARVTFQDYNLGFFRNFPNLSFSLKKVSVAGNGRFEGDTLAAFKSLDLVFNLLSLFFKSGYEVKSIIIDQAVVNAIVLKDGKANWDIARPSSSSSQINNNTSSAVTSPGSSVKILLRNLEIKNSSVSYSDSTMSLDTKVENLNFKLAGRMTLRETFVKMILSSGETTVIMGGIKYLNKVKIDSKIEMLADLDSMKFTMRDNFFSINELKIFLTGSVAKAGKNIKTDLHFGTDKSSFKTLMSLVPSVYMSGYEDLKASGEVSLSGSAKGTYSDADSTMPDVDLKFTVSNGLISYPALPEKISNINISANVFLDGKVFDRTTLNLEKFHFELAGSPFDMEFFMKTPVSDPDFKGSMNGKIDLNALSKALPMKGISLSGLMDISLSLAGKLSMIEKEQYESFSARGTLGIRDMVYSITGYPRVEIKSASLVFSPASTLIKSSDILVQRTSDFSVTGSLENYIPYLLKNKTLKANLAVHSNLTDVSEIMKGMTSDTVISGSASVANTHASDTAGLVIIPVPGNVAIDLNARITKLSYDKIRAENVTGHVIAKDRILSLRETTMNFMGGTILMNADYDTRDTLKPVMKADMNIKGIGVKDAFNTFNTVQKLAPAAKGIDGKINAKFAYVSLLGKDMMPVVNSINGEGKLQSDEITLLESNTFDQMKTVLKLGDSYSNTFKDINISFKISDGRIFVSPFDVKTGNLKMNISGDQGIDQTLNYIIKTEIPRSALGSSVNSLIDNLSTEAAKFGFAFKPSEVLKVNVKVTGTFSKPVVSPLFGNPAGDASGGAKEKVRDAAKQTFDSSVNMAKDKARADAELQGEKLLKDAELKGQQLRDEAARAADQLRKEADIQAKKLTDSTASRGPVAKLAARKGAESLKSAADKKAEQIVKEADIQANKLVEEARVKKDEMLKKF